jgi:hypothetical protein
VHWCITKALYSKWSISLVNILRGLRALLMIVESHVFSVPNWRPFRLFWSDCPMFLSYPMLPLSYMSTQNTNERDLQRYVLRGSYSLVGFQAFS